MAKKKKTFSALMIVVAALCFVILLLLSNSLTWMFTQTQYEILLMSIMLIGVAIFVFQDNI